MSRNLVLTGVFLAVLPGLMLSAKARGNDPPKKYSVDAGFSDAVKLTLPHKPKGDVAKPKPCSGPKLRGGEKAILKALKQRTSLDFAAAPLKDVLDFLSEKHRIPIRIDSSALKEAGVDESTSITCKLSGISLRSALEIILDEIQLKWAIRHDVLMITSPTKAESDEYIYAKLYDVTDLVATVMDYEVQNPLAPANEAPVETLMNGFNGAPSPAKGRFSSVARRIEPISYDIGGVKDALTNTIATRSWVDNGGTGTITAYDRMLIISQTREGHLQIEQFLADLRARRRAAPALSVELHWLWLNAKQRDRLMTGQTKPFGGQISMAVDPKHLQQVASDVPHIHGQVVCMNGIGTVIAAGDRRSIITGAIPVIGDCVGYQPVISVPNVGVTAQVRPTFIPGTKTAMLDIASIITRWEPSRKPAIIGAAWPSDKKVLAWNPPPVSPPAQNTTKDSPAATPPPIAPSVKTHSTRGGSASCPIDQPVMPTEQIGTTLRVPLGKPVIVGSITFAPEGSAGLGAAKEDPVEVYLIATTSIVRKAAK